MPNVSASCATLVPERARSTTCWRTSAGYLLGIGSSSLSAGGFQKRLSAKPGSDHSCTGRIQPVIATLDQGGVAMDEKRRAADRAGRPAMRSPGRPPVGRLEHRQRFWAAIARGLSSEDAAVQAGVSAAVGVRWFREGGGMPSVTLAPASGRYLSFAEREEIALLRTQKLGVREIARRIGRSPSTVSRELRRNAGTRTGSLTYRASTAQWHADRRGRRPKAAKLARSTPSSSRVSSRSRRRKPATAEQVETKPLGAARRRA